MPSPIISHVVSSIAPASRAHAIAARDRVASAGGLDRTATDEVAPELRASRRDPSRAGLGRSGVGDAGQPESVTTFERLAASLGGAQHTFRLKAKPRFVVVVAGDHGSDAASCAAGPNHPTAVAARAIASGTCALARIARTADAPIVLVDAGACEPAHFPTSAVAIGSRPSRDCAREPAMTIEEAYAALEAGIALAVTLSEQSLALLAVGAIGEGAERSAAALLSAITAVDAPIAGAEALARWGGPETGVLAGIMLGAASMSIPVILDSYATGAAALVAATLAPNAAGYLIASHRGSGAMPGILAHLGLEPLFEVGLGRGDGTGSTLVLPFVDQVASLVQDSR